MAAETIERFTCQRCGACCRVPGYVRVTEADCEALAALLGVSVETFIAEETDLAPARTGLVLKGEPNAPCRFLTAENLCRVHSAAPKQCRDYPARWRSEAIEAVCAARKDDR